MRPEFICQARVDSIITVVDAENIEKTLPDIRVVQNQIKFADFILLNKCDLIPKQKINTVKVFIREFNNDCRMLETVKCSSPLDLILGTRVHDEMMMTELDKHHSHSCDHECHHHDGVNHGFKSVSFNSDELFDPLKLQTFLQTIHAGVFRAKGFLRTKGSDQNYIFHLIAKRFTLDPDHQKRDPCNQLVFIGRDFDGDKLITDLRSCAI